MTNFPNEACIIRVLYEFLKLGHHASPAPIT